MKLKTTIMASTLALCLGSYAQAATDIRIVGSTAFRKSAHTAIGNILQAGYQVVFRDEREAPYEDDGTLLGSGEAIFHGNLVANGDEVYIKTKWSGSIGGVLYLDQHRTDKFIDDSVIATFNSSANTTNSHVDTSSPYSSVGLANLTHEGAAHQADVAMSDVYQSSTVYNDTHLNGAGGYTDGIVGVVAFEFVATPGCPATNMTPGLAQILFANGQAPLSTFLGSGIAGTTYEQTPVIAFGRDEDSGTRATAFAETGLGIYSYSQQYLAVWSGTTITGKLLCPQEWLYSTTGTNPFYANGPQFDPAAGADPNSIFEDVGQGGYNTGADLRAVMSSAPYTGTTPLAVLGGHGMTYLSTGDAGKATGCVVMTYNGVGYSTDAVQGGQYTFWSYEHCYYGSPTGDVKVAADAFAVRIHNYDAPVAGIMLSTMRVGRTTDGGLVTDNAYNGF